MARAPKSKIALLFVFLSCVMLATSAFAQGLARQPASDENTIADAYIYLLGRVLVIRQENMDRGSPGFAYNAIKYNPIGEADWVNPNLDTAYIEAWFAVDVIRRSFSRCRRSRGATTPHRSSTSGAR